MAKTVTTWCWRTACACLLLLVARPVGAQTCELRFATPGATAIGVELIGLTDESTLGVRHYGSRFWAGAFGGTTPDRVEGIAPGTDQIGPYLGVTEIIFLGIGGEVGGGVSLGPLTVCAAGGLRLGFEQSATVRRFYTNQFGQTVGFDEEELDSNYTARRWNFDVSADHLVTQSIAAGLGLFVETSTLLADGAVDPLRDVVYAGVTAGARLTAVGRLLFEASYRHPLDTFDGDRPAPDGSFVLRGGWIL